MGDGRHRSRRSTGTPSGSSVAPYVVDRVCLGPPRVNRCRREIGFSVDICRNVAPDIVDRVCWGPRSVFLSRIEGRVDVGVDVDDRDDRLSGDVEVRGRNSGRWEVEVRERDEILGQDEGQGRNGKLIADLTAGRGGSCGGRNLSSYLQINELNHQVASKI
jgi:hypothetical protein